MAESGTLPTSMQECHRHYQRLRMLMDRWLDQSLRLDARGAQGGGGDEVNYALAWIPHYLITRNEKLAAHFRSLIAVLGDWLQRECVHGYPPRTEAHHGPEAFVLFLPQYLGLFGDNDAARSILEDAAHHVGNWAGEVPAWYDYTRDRFRSWRLGTRVVDDSPEFAVEAAEHLRFIHLALAAHRVLEEDRYADWALRYGRRRARRIVECDGPLPVLYDSQGRGLYQRDLTSAALREAAADVHHLPDDPLAGVENLIASGAIYAFGDLFALSGEEVFHLAARRLVEPLVGQIADPYADPGAAAVSYYRAAFRDVGFDTRIRRAVDQFPPAGEAELAIMMHEKVEPQRAGVGKRYDMVYWGRWSERGAVEHTVQPSPAALALAFQLTGDVSFAERALGMAAARLGLAVRALRSGREHSDRGPAVCSVAAGHGRNWGVGAVTGCYGPLLLGTRLIRGAVEPAIELLDEAGRICLPDNLLSLVVPPAEGDGQVRFYNGGETPLTAAWRPAGHPEATPVAVRLNPQQVATFALTPGP